MSVLEEPPVPEQPYAMPSRTHEAATGGESFETFFRREYNDSGPTILARGEHIELVGDDGFAGQTLNIDAEEQGGEVTGEIQISDNVIPVECADTDTDGVVVLGGRAISGGDFDGDLLALIIREGDPDLVHLFGNDSGAASCTEMLDSIPDDLLADNDPTRAFDVVEAGDIETR